MLNSENSIFPSALENLNLNIYRTIVLRVVAHGYKVLSLISTEFDNSVLRTLEPKGEEMIRRLEKNA
jgi:fumarate hydratase class II